MKQIPLTQGKFALVDDEDFEFLNQFKWQAANFRGVFYASRKINKNGKWGNVFMHRQILGLTDPKVQTDHINGDGLDNQRSNLRACTHSQNQRNKGKYKQNTSGFKGCSWYKRLKKWRVQITVNGKDINVGYFNSKDAAAHAYNEKAKEFHGEFARLNEI